MPRKKIIRTNEFPYHVTSRSNHKLWFNLPMEKVWRIFEASFRHAHKKYPSKLHVAVCMSNHYHMLIQMIEHDIDQFMFEFNSYFSKQIRAHSGLINRMLGKRYHWSIVQDQRYYFHVYRYIYQNPVRAGLCNRVEDYPFSTLSPISRLRVKALIKPDLEWLNYRYSEEQIQSIKSGLNKGHFAFTNIPDQKRPPRFDTCP